MTDLSLLGDDEADKLAGLVFELAAQLHVERTRRRALEELLVRTGTVDRAAIDDLANDAEFLKDSRSELDIALRRLLTIVAEAGNPAAPLRDEALADR